jgi:hypothetical protein
MSDQEKREKVQEVREFIKRQAQKMKEEEEAQRNPEEEATAAKIIEDCERGIEEAKAGIEDQKKKMMDIRARLEDAGTRMKAAQRDEDEDVMRDITQEVSTYNATLSCCEMMITMYNQNINQYRSEALKMRVKVRRQASERGMGQKALVPV